MASITSLPASSKTEHTDASTTPDIFSLCGVRPRTKPLDGTLPDLSRQQCDECSVGALPIIRNCCDGKLGSRVLRPSCNFRYEIYSFIESPLSRPPLSPPPPLSPVFLPLNRITHGYLVTLLLPLSSELLPFFSLHTYIFCFQLIKMELSSLWQCQLLFL
uniref:Gnk2-homologous domain-containing protein n=1 Tax=Cucumis sativus TaxID=3659 RepID=A0A0A0KTC9_CUCSA